MKFRYSALPLILSFLAVAACGDDDPTGPEACTDDTGAVAVDVTVETGGSVVFDWEPSCAVALLLVEEDGHDMWGLLGREDLDDAAPESANRIEPPVTYGVRPEGIVQLREPEPLEAETSYEFVLWRVLPQGSDAECQQRLGTTCLLAVHEFVR